MLLLLLLLTMVLIVVLNAPGIDSSHSFTVLEVFLKMKLIGVSCREPHQKPQPKNQVKNKSKKQNRFSAWKLKSNLNVTTHARGHIALTVLTVTFKIIPKRVSCVVFPPGRSYHKF